MRGAFFHHTLLTNKTAADRMDIAIEMAKSAIAVVLRNIPPRPEEGKWTSTAPALDFALLLRFPNHLLELLLDAAEKIITVKVGSFDGVWKNLTWAQAQSVRLEHSKLLFADGLARAAILLVVEQHPFCSRRPLRSRVPTTGGSGVAAPPRAGV